MLGNAALFATVAGLATMLPNMDAQLETRVRAVVTDLLLAVSFVSVWETPAPGGDNAHELGP